MHRIILFVLVVATFQFSCGTKAEKTETTPEDQVSINSLMKSYSNAFTKKDWNAILNHIYPEVFKYVSKEDFKNALETAFEASGFIIDIKGLQVDSVSSMVSDGSNKYAMSYNKIKAVLTMDTSVSLLFSSSFDEVCNNMKEELKDDAVTCYPEDKRIEYSISDKSYIVFDSKTKKWYLLGNNEENPAMVEKVIPGAVRKQFAD